MVIASPSLSKAGWCWNEGPAASLLLRPQPPNWEDKILRLLLSLLAFSNAKSGSQPQPTEREYGKFEGILHHRR